MAKTNKPTEATNKPATIATQSAKTATGVMAMFADTPLTPIVDNPFGSPYVQFFHMRAKNAPKLIAAFGPGLVEGEPILVDGNGFTRLKQLQFILTPKYFQYYAKVDTENEILEAMVPDTNTGKVPKGFVEFIEAVLLVVFEGEVSPARCRFRGPKCPAVKAAIYGISDTVRQPGWQGENKDNGIAAKSSAPSWAWLTFDVTLTRKQGESNAYDEAHATPLASRPAVLSSLIKQNADKEFVDTMQSCIDDFDKFAEEVRKKC